MPDTTRTIAAILALFRDGQDDFAITEQAVRDLIVSLAPPESTLLSGAAITWNLDTHPVARTTLAGDTTVTVIGGIDGGSYRLAVIEDGTGSHSIATTGMSFVGTVAWNIAPAAVNFVEVKVVNGTRFASVSSGGTSSLTDVRAYGALGDGTTDDTAAIHAALVAAGTGTVTFPPGTYNITSTIVVTSAACIQLQKGATVFLVAGSNCHMFSLRAAGCVIYGPGVIDVNGTNNEGGTDDFVGVQILSADRCHVSNVEIKNYLYAGAEILSASNCVIESCYIHTTLTVNPAYGVFINYGSVGSSYNLVHKNCIDTTGDGVWSGGNGTTPPTIFSSHNVISNNEITSHRIAIEVWGGSPYTTIANNNIVSLGDLAFGWGISVAVSDHTSVVGNVCNVATFTGIEIAGSAYCAVTGNTIYGNATAANGITVSGAPGANNTIVGNTVDSCLRGVYSECPHTLIEGNSLSNLTGKGIEFNGGDYQTATGNHINTSDTAIIFEENSHLTCTSNTIIATSNGIQFVANSGTRDFIILADNTITAGLNPTVFTGSLFGLNVHENTLKPNNHYFTTTSSLHISPVASATVNGTGVDELSLFQGGVLRITGGKTGQSTSLNLINDNNIGGQFAVASHTVSPYHGVTADCLFGYTSKDIAFVADGGTINLGTAGGQQVSVVNTATAVNILTLTGAATGTNVQIGATGTDSNIGLVLNTKGSGGVVFFGPECDGVYSKQVPTTGFSITMSTGRTRLILDPAGTLATGTVTMPASPTDGQLAIISSTQTITGLTVSPNSGQSIKNAPTTLSAGGKIAFIYVLANTTWYIS